MSFELFRRIAHDAISTPGSRPRADRTLATGDDRCRPSTRERRLCDLDAVTDPGRSPIPDSRAPPVEPIPR